MIEEKSTMTGLGKKQSGSFCCRIIRSRLIKLTSISKQQVKIYVALFLCMFGVSYSITMIFPFLPFMVRFLLPELDSSSVGKYAGMIASSMYLGRIISSYIWGALSDSFGHKRVLIIGNILLGISLPLFGLSVNFPMAIAMRLLIGLINGVTGSTKACMAENSNNENQALGMAIMSLSWGVGIVLGPAISAVTADPIGQYNLNITNNAVNYFFTTFPYFLPCFANALIFFGSAIGVLVLLPRQNKKLSFTEQSKSLSEDTEHSLKPDYKGFTIHNGIEPLGVQELQLLPDGIEEKDVDIQREEEIRLDNEDSGSSEMNTGSRKEIKITAKMEGKEEESRDVVGVNGNLIFENKNNEHQLPSSKTWQPSTFIASGLKSLHNLKYFFRDPVVRLTMIIYSVFCAAEIGFDEAYSLWSSTPAYLGGLSFSLSEVGTSLSIVGVLLLPFTVFFYPFHLLSQDFISIILERRLGAIGSLLMTSVVLIFCLVLLPNLYYFVLLRRPVVLWVVLCTIMLVIRVAIIMGFASTTLFINNSVTFDKLGSVNGLTMTMVSTFRVFSPVLVGNIYSASLSEANQSLGFPVNYHLIFIIFGLIQIVIMIMTAFLPPSINKQKIAHEDLQTSSESL